MYDSVFNSVAGKNQPQGVTYLIASVSRVTITVIYHKINNGCNTNTVNTRIHGHMISGFRLTYLFIGCLVRNQPENVLKMFLNFVSEILHMLSKV